MRRAVAASLVCVTMLVPAACGSGTSPVTECSEERIATGTGLELRDLECGYGAEAVRGASVTIAYTAALEEGEEFDSSTEEEGGLTFRLGRGQVLAGLEEGVRGMLVGGRRRLVLPPRLAYGAAGFPPDVPPGATVVFEVELLKVGQP